MSGQDTNTNDEYVVDDPEILKKLEEYVDWKNLPRRHFIHHIERGRLGLNIGLPNGLKKINEFIHGTGNGTYHLCGADSGVGKTTLTDFMFVLSAYEHCKKTGKKLYIHYFSFEISRHQKYLKWVAYYAWMMFKIRLPTKYMDGKIVGIPVTDEHMKLITIAYAYVEQLMESIVFIDDVMHPTAIWAHMLEHFGKIGTITYGPPTAHNKRGRITNYKLHKDEEDSMTMAVLDHIALVGVEQSFGTKQLMDLMSKYFVALRNLFELTPIVVQQFNSELTTMNRDSYKKVTEGSIAPQRVDFGDSTYTYRDADIVFGLISPAKFDMKSFHGYDVTKYNSMLIILFLMKNRYGEADQAIPLFLDPISGTFHDINHFTEGIFTNTLKEIELCQSNYRSK